jgi:hypothetical protein
VERTGALEATIVGVVVALVMTGALEVVIVVTTGASEVVIVGTLVACTTGVELRVGLVVGAVEVMTGTDALTPVRTRFAVEVDPIEPDTVLIVDANTPFATDELIALTALL